ncbi:OapC/ArvC family zinc-ribbon domain-containing protein [Halopenitus persicus]|uniref:OapC/ArvC family zinc-ribbon domain-containing protein n=1 Tax=Halopenitus persicus TaxID=1048396 RepID=UPI000BBAAB68|nr:Zn-ribbon containing protein [Halopenitus persicus]
MPHQCTVCGHVFPDGSKEMLSGCPDCGGNKFQFKPGSIDEPSADATNRPEGGSATADAATDDVTIEADRETTPDSDRGTTPDSDRETTPDSDRDAEVTVATDAPAADPNEAPSADADTPTDADIPTDAVPPSSTTEDDAQASARSEVVSSDELSVTSNPDAGTSSSGEDASGPHGRNDAATADPDAADTIDASDAAEPRTDADDDRPGLDALRQELNDQFESIRIVSPGQYELNLMELYDRQEYIISLQEDGRYVIEMPGDWGPDEE